MHLVTTGRKTGLPRPVTVFFIYFEGRLFVRTQPRNQWRKNVKANPKVKAEIDGLEFSAEVEQVEDKAIIKKIRRGYLRKYHIFDIIANIHRMRGEDFLELKVITLD